MKAKEFRGLTLEDLKKRSAELREELFNTKLQNVAGSLENTAKIRDLRREVARVLSVINEKVSR